MRQCEIEQVSNYSRDWVIMKLELRVPLDTDMEKVRKLVKAVAQQMLARSGAGGEDPTAAEVAGPPPDGAHRRRPTGRVDR